MDLHRPGWLREFLYLLLGGYQEDQARARLELVAAQPSAQLAQARLAGPGKAELAHRSARARVLRHMDLELRRSGLLYGSPKLPSRLTRGRRLDRAAAHFISVLAGKSFLALDVDRIYGLPFDPEEAQGRLSFLLAAGVGRIDLATSIAAAVGASEARPRGRIGGWMLGRAASRGRRAELGLLQEQLEKTLIERIASATGATVFDLPLHNNRVYGEARLIGHLALDLHGVGHFRPLRARRLLAASRQERARLLPALVAPARLQRKPSDGERRAIARELRELVVSRARSRQLRLETELVPTPRELARRIPTRSARRFALEQAWLATMIGGLDEAEDRFLVELSEAFGFPDDTLATIEAEVADYFYDPEEIIDSFEIRAKANENSGRLADRVERELIENLDRIALEVKETGELAQFLAKAAVGHKLTPVERAKAREQLIDLAKVVPSLAIFAAPGGMLILAALAKLLPFSLLPSSFQPTPEAAPRPPSRLRSKSRSG